MRGPTPRKEELFERLAGRAHEEKRRSASNVDLNWRSDETEDSITRSYLVLEMGAMLFYDYQASRIAIPLTVKSIPLKRTAVKGYGL